MHSLDAEQLTEDLLQNKIVVGLILAGSTSKKLQTKNSDLDVYIILKSNASKAEITELKNVLPKKYYGKNLDLSNQAIQTIEAFKDCALVGTEYDWDRYNLVHTELLFDKTAGILAKILQSKEVLTNNEATILIDNNLGAYINLTYRSLQSLEARNRELARLDQAEAVMYMLIVLFAFQGRVRPFNKYLLWEFEQYPLNVPGINNQQLYELILASSLGNDATNQIKIYGIIEKIARAQGHSDVFEA